MIKKILLPILVLLILGLIFTFITRQPSYPDQSNSDILYWGSTCPACHQVIDWIEKNQVDQKLSIIRKEVYQNRQNSNELSQKATKCGLDSNQIGIPLLYTLDGQCLIGVPNITDYLSTKL